MLKSLNHILLGAFENQPQWKGQQQLQQILDCWVQVVGVKDAQQTRPHSIVRDTLYVATSSSVWVQDLQLKRHFILKQINARLSSPLTDLRFSTAYWHRDELAPSSTSTSWQEHPSHWTETTSVSPVSQPPSPKTPHLAFQQWAEGMQARSQQFPLCPQCHCPTPPGELQRWRVCGLCAAKQWRQH